MSTSSVVDNKELFKETLMGELKAYKNISVKLALVLWSLSFVIHYTCSIINKASVTVQVGDALYQSFLTSLIFALLGYCVGSVIGLYLQKDRLSAIKRVRDERKRYVQEQVSIRQAKLQGL